MPEQFPESMRRFIRQYIESVEQLEILLLVSRNPQRGWTVEDVNKTIKSNPNSVAERMKTLKALGFFSFNEESGDYRFSPHPSELAQRVNELDQLYETWRVRVIETIFSGPGKQAQHFADSFKLKKDK